MSVYIYMYVRERESIWMMITSIFQKEIDEINKKYRKKKSDEGNRKKEYNYLFPTISTKTSFSCGVNPKSFTSTYNLTLKSAGLKSMCGCKIELP